MVLLSAIMEQTHETQLAQHYDVFIARYDVVSKFHETGSSCMFIVTAYPCNWFSYSFTSRHINMSMQHCNLFVFPFSDGGWVDGIDPVQLYFIFYLQSPKVGPIALIYVGWTKLSKFRNGGRWD